MLLSNWRVTRFFVVTRNLREAQIFLVLWTLNPGVASSCSPAWITYMLSVRVLENTTFCSLFTNRLRRFHLSYSNQHQPPFLFSSETWDTVLPLNSLSLLVFRACNDFCTVLSRTVWNTFTLQMCFCISARLCLIGSLHSLFGTIYSVFSLIRPNTERAFCCCCYFWLANIRCIPIP